MFFIYLRNTYPCTIQEFPYVLFNYFFNYPFQVLINRGFTEPQCQITMQYAFIKLRWHCLELKQINRSLFFSCWMAFVVCILQASQLSAANYFKGSSYTFAQNSCWRV